MMREAVSELPRLLFCCFDVVPSPTAASRRLTEYLKGLTERFQVVVLTLKTPDHPHIEKYHGARLLRVPVGGGDFPSRAQAFDRAVRRQLESEEYGLVHFFDPFAGYAICERRAELGYRLVYDACTFPSLQLPLEQPALSDSPRLIARIRRQELFCLMNADGVVVGSPLTERHVVELGVERARVRVLRAPVPLEDFTAAAAPAPAATALHVLHLGRATPGRGLEVLLEAVQRALPAVDLRVTLVCAGPDEARARLEALAAERGLAPRLSLQDPVAHEQLPALLATTDVAVLSLDDTELHRQVGTPLARLGEYLAAGRPVIAADVPAARALLPAERAVWYPPGDAAALSAALTQLAGDPRGRASLGAAARAAAVDWDSARVCLQLVKLYADVTGATAGLAPDRPAEPWEPTQLGRPQADSGEVTQLRSTTGEDSSVGANKVKTDPAISVGATTPADEATQAARVAVPAPPGAGLTDAAAPPDPEPPAGPLTSAAAREQAVGAALLAPLAAPSVSTPASAEPPVADEPEEIGEHEVMELEAEEIPEVDAAVEAIEAGPSPPDSAIGPWLAQLLHGYCPPESQRFERHTPPTTRPGRDT
jgi:glycosyltransferase involved in cell wall biosynthesis